jgi:hypothetical protein
MIMPLAASVRSLPFRLRVADLALLVVVVGAGIRIWRWSLAQPLWLDEQMISINLRDRGFFGLTGKLSLDQSAPLGWLWTQWLVSHVLGNGERALRLVPLLFGVGTLVVAWLIGRRWLGPVGTLVLVGLCAVNPSMLRYSTEVKQYSGDIFWVFVLIGLAGWVIEQRQRPVRAMVSWWATAAVASWFSMAAILATPGLAAVLFIAAWRRNGRRMALNHALLAVPWLISFGLHYLLALRFAIGDPTLTEYWQRYGYPPKTGGIRAAAQWLVRRPGGIAKDPVGVSGSFAVAFWAVAAAGMVTAALSYPPTSPKAIRRRLEYGLLLAVPAATGFALAVLRVVPLAGRLALWLVPALLLAVAVTAEALTQSAARAWRLARVSTAEPPATAEPTAAAHRRLPSRVVLAGVAVVALVAIALGALAVRPEVAGAARRPPQAGGVDDRAAMAYITSIYRPGDLILVTASSWPAAQWYGTRSVRAVTRTVKPLAAGPRCAPNELSTAVQGYRRVLAYAGAPTSILPRRDDVLRWRLSEVGRIVQQRTFATDALSAGSGWLYIVDLTGSAGAQPSQSLAASALKKIPYGCLSLSAR